LGVVLTAGQKRMPRRHNRKTVRVVEPAPLGDVTLAPAQASGQSEAALARAMADTLIAPSPRTNRKAFDLLRRLFPNSPLTIRVAALGALMRR
jgi:hypothetical protein